MHPHPDYAPEYESCFRESLDALTQDSHAESFLYSHENYWTGDGWEFFSSLEALRNSAATSSENAEACPQLEYDQWGADFFDWFTAQAVERRTFWMSVLEQANVTASKPSATWYKKALKLIESDKGFEAELESVLSLLTDANRSACKYYAWADSIQMIQEYSGQMIHPGNVNTIKGLVWFGALINSERMAATLGSVGVASAKKISGYGARSVKLANAAVTALADSGLASALGHVNRISDANQYSQIAKVIQARTKDLRAAFEEAGLDADDQHEVSAPSMELNSDFEVRQNFGDIQGIIRVESTSQIQLLWLKKGKEQKSVPVEVKDDYSDELKAFRKDRSWKFDEWKERFIDSPTLNVLAKDIIWQCNEKTRTIAFMFRDGVAVDVNGKKLPASVEKATITLWHPVEKTCDEVESWREKLFQLQLAQPFKQAFREVYLVTDAEKETALYSNRYAGHVILQPTFAALVSQRGWSFDMIGTSGEYCMQNDAEKIVNGLQASFAVQETAVEHTTANNYYQYLATDQVQFSNGEGRVNIADVPPLVFSELMRDIDLFIGTCSIATDPEWQDSGLDGYQGLWENTAFGELTSTAETRKSALELMLPNLSIAKQCSLKGRYLVVEGKLRDYKIHLGSGNILMTPNDQYLCIVPDRSSNEMKKVNRLFLPFQEDYLLSLVLSKAFLLADDDKIVDASITSQIALKRAG